MWLRRVFRAKRTFQEEDSIWQASATKGVSVNRAAG
jgi:hypothetical protein